MRRAWPHLAALAAVTAWGISFVATKAALREVTPATLVFSRFAMGVVLLHVLLAVRRTPLRPPRKHVPTLLLLGFVGVFVHQMIQVNGLARTTAVRTGWLIGLIPIWSALLAAAFLKERFGARKTAGLVLGFAGAILVVTRGRFSTDVLALPSTTGDLLVLASTLNWAIYSALGRETIRELGALRAIAGAMLPGWLMLGPVWAAERGWREYAGLSPGTWGALLFLGIVCSGFAYLAWYAALKRLETGRVAAYLYVEPLVTLAAAVTLLDEPVAATTIAGGLVVLLGVFLVQRG